jgi:hypothetical protein
MARLIKQGGIVVFFGFVFGCIGIYKFYFPDTPMEVKEPKAQPSQPVLVLMMMLSSSVPLLISGYLV